MRYEEPKREYEETVVNVRCSCGCGVFTIYALDLGGKKDKENWDYYGLYYKLSHGKASTIRKALAEKAKLLWCVLTGKEYIFYDISLEKEDLEKFQDALNHVLEME